MAAIEERNKNDGHLWIRDAKHIIVSLLWKTVER